MGVLGAKRSFLKTTHHLTVVTRIKMTKNWCCLGVTAEELSQCSFWLLTTCGRWILRDIVRELSWGGSGIPGRVDTHRTSIVSASPWVYLRFTWKRSETERNNRPSLSDVPISSINLAGAWNAKQNKIRQIRLNNGTSWGSSRFRKVQSRNKFSCRSHCYPIYSAWMMIYKNVEKE